ncbi:MAG: FtsX-like permease family protein [Acidimicrobiales bacterium]
MVGTTVYPQRDLVLNGVMSAVAYRVRRVLRTTCRATLRLIVAVALISGVVLAVTMGAERTSSAPDRYEASRRGDLDAVVTQARGRPLTDKVRALPGAASVKALTFVFGGVTKRGGSQETMSFVFAGSYVPFGDRLVSGRNADPARPTEFVATRNFVDAYRASIGDRFDMMTLTQDQADSSGFNTKDPAGPRSRAVLVGIVDGPSGFNDPTPVAVFSPSLLHDRRIGVAATIMSATLRPGTDLASFRSQLDTLRERKKLSLERAVIVDPSLRTAVRAQGRGLWLLAFVAAVASVAALGQLVARRVRLSTAQRTQLAAVGFTGTQAVAESTALGAVPVLAGVFLGAGLATLASQQFPTGFVRRIEPSPGLRVEPLVLMAGTVGFAVFLMLWILLALSLTRRSLRRQPSGFVEQMAARSPSATASTGVRFAFMRGERDIGSIRGTVLGMVMTVAILMGTVTFGASLGRLVDDPARSGSNYDMAVGDGADVVSAKVRSGLDADPDVSALMLYANGQVRVGSVTLQLVAMEPVRGDAAPRILAGRLPSSDDEIALGRLAARSFGAKVGGDLSVKAGTRTKRYRVTGLTVIPSIGINDGVGQDGLVTLAGLRRVDPQARSNTAAVTFRKGAPPGTIRRLSRTYGGDPAGPQLADSIANLVRIRSIPYLLAGLLGALAMVTVAHAMLTSIDNRRRDVAILRSIGADRPWITRAVHWQATALALLPLAIGTPLGLIFGQVVFRAFADSIGTVNDPSRPYLVVAATFGGLILLANVVASVPARRARRRSPARIIHAA